MPFTMCSTMRTCALNSCWRFKRLTKSLNLLFPARQALRVHGRLQGTRRDQCARREAFPRPAVEHEGNPGETSYNHGCPPRVPRAIDIKVPPISILDEDFEKGVSDHRRTKTKAAEIEHAIRHHLDVDLDDDPDLRASFAEALAAIFDQFRNNWNKIYEELEKLRTRIINASNEPTYGLHRKKQMPFFRMFQL